MDKYLKKIEFDFTANNEILKNISFIDSFKGRWNTLEKQENIYLKELRQITTIESIGSSTRIEGAVMTNSQIKELLDNLKITKLHTRDEQEVVGYYDVLELIYENYSDIHLSKNYILQLHKTLLNYSTKDERHKGKYKNQSNQVVASYPDGTQKVIFETTAPHLVENEMDELIDWCNLQFSNQTLHPLIITAIFIYEFLSIHPFQDGNGRLSRILTTLLLLQNQYLFIKYISFENHIEQKKKTYYEALMSGQKDRNSETEKIDKWLLFFLSSIKNLIIKLEQKYDVFKSKGGYLNPRQKQIKEFIEKNQPVKISDIINALSEISPNTIKKDVKYLKRENIITAVGKGKATIYIIYKTDYRE